MSHGPRRLTKQQLDQEIAALLKSGITSCREMASLMGHSRSTISQRLLQLEAANHAHRRKYTHGLADAWFYGPALGKDGLPLSPQKPLYATERATQGYAEFPLVDGRNMLDFYLFGPAKRRAPRCTACGVDQGEQHLAGCIVALVAA
ncbi:hypothetical protein LE190_16075 [Massilia oculi]|uniref:Uncharacterized protein n=1 Tax=Massilia hydrophila TaxID=3044279 RepID=A0ABS7YCK8_9BURK|nr:hypothetical protein [Massilia oculi]MCA1857431.1 hypothetical protein [Massilia oculi]